MFERMLKAGEHGTGSRKVLSLGLAFALHGGALAAALAASLVVVGAVGDPDVFIPIYNLGAPPPPPPPPPPPAAKASSAAAVVKPALPDEPSQPTNVLPITDADNQRAASSDDTEGDDESGAPGGVPGGVRGGVPGGVPGGDPDNGVLGAGLLPGDGRESAGPRVITSDISPPVLIHRIEPVYPETARRVRLTGTVTLKAVISETGDVERVEVLRGATFLTEAAVDAVRQWKYRPALMDGRPVSVYFTVVVTFRLE